MAIFGKKLKTAEEVLKAVDSLPEDEKGKFMEAIKDHVDESVAAQEVDEGETDEQTAEDRIDESEGEENAIAEEDEHKDDEEFKDAETPDEATMTDEVADETPTAEAEEVATEEVPQKTPETQEDQNKLADLVKALGERVEALETELEAMRHKSVEADKNTASKLDKLASRFGG